MMKLRLLNCLSTKTLTPVVLLPNIRSFSQFSIQRHKTSIIYNSKLNSTWAITPLIKSPPIFIIRSYATKQVQPEDEDEEDRVTKKDVPPQKKKGLMGVERPITVNNLLPEMDKYGYMSLVILAIAGAAAYYFYSDTPPIADLIVDYGVDQIDLNKETATQAFQLARTINPSNKYAWFNEANILAEQGQLKKAIKYYSKAIEADPNYVDAHYNKGILLFMLKRYEAALSQFDKVLAINPKFAYALNNKGNALVELQRFEDARKAYDEAIKLDDMFAEAIENKKRLDLIEKSLQKKKGGWF